MWIGPENLARVDWVLLITITGMVLQARQEDLYAHKRPEHKQLLIPAVISSAKWQSGITIIIILPALNVDME